MGKTKYVCPGSEALFLASSFNGIARCLVYPNQARG